MPISKDEFRSIEEDGPSLPDLAPDTTQGAIYRSLAEHADQAFRQREIVERVSVPEGSVGPTLARLEGHSLVDHRDRFWTIADTEHAVASAGMHAAATANSVDGGFSDDEVDAWMETAVDPIQSATKPDEEWRPMAERGDVVWAPDPFKTDNGNPRPWLVVPGGGLPYPDEESIAVAFTTQPHHAGSFAVPSDAWVRGEPAQQSYILPWTIATLKDYLHVVGQQGSVTDEFAERVMSATISYLNSGEASDSG